MIFALLLEKVRSDGAESMLILFVVCALYSLKYYLQASLTWVWHDIQYSVWQGT